VAISIRTQGDLRPLQRLPFCYLCGLPIGTKGGDPTWTREHVPPNSLFLPADRTPPLVLPAHRTCNGNQSGADEVMGELVELLHGRTRPPDRRRVRLSAPPELPPGLGAVSDDLKGFIWRWVRGFHSALYRSFLPEAAPRVVMGPIMAGVIKDGKPFAVDDPEMFKRAVDTVKNNAAGGNVDFVVTRNGKCVYECVWDDAVERSSMQPVPICLFRLRVYDWERLSRGTPAKFTGCAGSYGIEVVPPGVARATPIVISGTNYQPLSAFEP
jgi:hypothetical protein